VTAPTFPAQIAELNHASLVYAANGGAITKNGFGDDMDAALIALGRQRAMLEYLIRCGINDGDALRAALAKREDAK
jgi:hypothetical protein